MTWTSVLMLWLWIDQKWWCKRRLASSFVVFCGQVNAVNFLSTTHVLFFAQVIGIISGVLLSGGVWIRLPSSGQPRWETFVWSVRPFVNNREEVDWSTRAEAKCCDDLCAKYVWWISNEFHCTVPLARLCPIGGKMTNNFLRTKRCCLEQRSVMFRSTGALNVIPPSECFPSEPWHTACTSHLHSHQSRITTVPVQTLQRIYIHASGNDKGSAHYVADSIDSQLSRSSALDPNFSQFHLRQSCNGCHPSTTLSLSMTKHWCRGGR